MDLANDERVGFVTLNCIWGTYLHTEDAQARLNTFIIYYKPRLFRIVRHSARDIHNTYTFICMKRTVGCAAAEKYIIQTLRMRVRAMIAMSASS